MTNATVKSQFPATILLVVGEPGVARTDRLELEGGDFAVVVAGTAAEGLERVAGGQFDLIVADHRFSADVSSLEVLRQVRAAGHLIPSVLVTGSFDEKLLLDALRAGVRDVIRRTPDSLEPIAPSVWRVLEQVRSERAAAESRMVASEHEAQKSHLEREIAQRKRAEQALHEAEEYFRAVVETVKATGGVKDAELRQDQFLATLGHQLRNPLTPISNAVQIMQLEGPNGANFRWCVEVISDQIKHMTRTIDELLDLARVTRGKADVHTSSSA
jgi:signal transduction histidine kinase